MTSRKWIGARNSAVLVALVALVGWLAQCGPAAPSADSGIDAALQLEVLESLGRHVLAPTYRRFAEAAAELERATQAYAASLADEDRLAAQSAWREAMDQWQLAEPMQVGPAAPATRPGGRFLRDDIYSFPVTNPCRIDQETAEQSYTDLEALAAQPVNVRGLDAIEYLLFVPSADNACAPTSPINTDGRWAALGADEIARRRAAHAAALAALVRRAADELDAAWDPARGNFAAELASPGAGRLFASPSEAVDAITDAMFYLDTVTKDRKLAVPLGLRGCAAEACPELVESPLAGTAALHVEANLRAFELLFLGAEPGTEAPGLDDLLASVGQEALAVRMAENLAAARASAASIDAPLSTAIVDDRAAVEALYAAVKRVTDDLKGPFVTALRLTIPAEGAGDTD